MSVKEKETKEERKSVCEFERERVRARERSRGIVVKCCNVSEGL